MVIEVQIFNLDLFERLQITLDQLQFFRATLIGLSAKQAHLSLVKWVVLKVIPKDSSIKLPNIHWATRP